MSQQKIKDVIKNDVPSRSIGGQAVMEGVMMRGKKMYAVAVRKPNNEIVVDKKAIASSSNKIKTAKIPIVRGVVAFVDSLVIGMKVMTYSAEIAGFEETNEEPGKFQKFLEDKFGDKLSDYLIYFSVAVSILFSVALFMLLPVWITSFTKGIIGEKTWALGIIEGLVRFAIFFVYIILISKMKDIQRVFQYHGAEHKTINCFESGKELTVQNVRKHTRFHKRCGTSFLLIVMVVSMIVFLFVRTDVVWLRFVSRIILVPVVAGLSYEVIKWAGNSSSPLVGIISFPGICLQKITTAEPDDSQIETAIEAMKGVLEDEAE